MNNSSEPPPLADDAFAAADFWLQLEISLELIRDGSSDQLLRVTMAEFEPLAARLEFDMARDVSRWAMWQHARTLVAATPKP